MIECQVGKISHKILWVHNYTKKKLKYKVNFFNNVTNLFLSKGGPLCFTVATITVIADTLIKFMFS